MKVPEVKIYQFGSSLSSETPNDLDILIIYRISNLAEIDQIIRFKMELKLNIETLLSIPVDVILLSEKEVLQTHYLDKIVSQRVF
ncbi:hypothetical protein IGJ02_000397 [Enterococcus sp. DIV0724b]